MKIVAKSCPKCHAPLTDQSRFCSHCGIPLVIEDESSKLQYTYQKVDDARIREADVHEKIRLKELEIDSLKLQNESKLMKTAVMMKLAVLFGLLAVLFLLIIAIITTTSSNIRGTCVMLCLAILIVLIIVIPKVFQNK